MVHIEHVRKVDELIARTVYLPTDLDRQLVAESERTQQTTSVIIYECVRIMFEHYPEELRGFLSLRA